MAHYFLGLDLGGTNVKSGITDGEGKLVAQISVPTGHGLKDLTADNVIARMVEAGKEVMGKAGLKKQEVEAVGILAPGQASLSKGIVFRSANLPLWKNVPIRAKVTAGLGIPGILENDANAAAYGEYWAGAGKGGKVQNLVMFTLGTGVGGGVVLDGKVIRGSFDFAAEVGHMIMVPDGELCGCGQHGCLEAYCSAGYTGKRATRAMEESKVLQKSSSLGKVLKEKGKITSADVAQHAKAGDKFALQMWNDTCKFIALASINAIHWLDPQMIVLAGGMTLAGKFLTDTVNKHYREQWWKMVKPTCKITLAKLGNDAGVIGAAGVAKDAFDRKELPAVGK